MSLHALPNVQDGGYDSLCRAARAYADRLGLRNHAIEVMQDEPPRDPDALAEVELATGRAHVRLRVRADFALVPPEEQRLALTHEFLHPHLQRLTERVHDHVAAEIGGSAFRIFWRGFAADTEELVDSLAQLLAPTMPMIDWEGGEHAQDQDQMEA